MENITNRIDNVEAELESLMVNIDSEKINTEIERDILVMDIDNLIHYLRMFDK